MNSSTLRRLIADHADLHNNELPPYYLFDGLTPDTGDLTQLSILITGPPGTPYESGLWKLHLRIPFDYPKSPPKAAFKTKIWHPNVEESSGAVCLETLKRDWESKLTLRDILVTISCLLINPNPDSALNAAAGKLLQEEYGEFARQARLMTSIHAGIAPSLASAAEAARSRGEDKLVALQHEDEESDGEDGDEGKENNPALSQSPITFPPPALPIRRPILGKRPLSDLPTPPLDEDDEPISCSERNIAAGATAATPNLSSDIACMSVNGSSNATFTIRPDPQQPPTKRLCFGDRGKENVSDRRKDLKTEAAPLTTTTSSSGPLVGLGVANVMNKAPGQMRKQSQSSKLKTGLRRL